MGQGQSQFRIYPFTLSSQPIPFDEWVTILTIALAPLIAHIAAGTPHPSILTKQDSRLPKWHDTICLYNPTSILWRYAAIADRRIRAKDWSVADMAATNAIFWTGTTTNKRRNISASYTTFDGKETSGQETSQQQAQDLEHAHSDDESSEEGGWNGTEEMILASLPYCTELPLHARAEVFSWETIKTIIITLQGAQMLSTLVKMGPSADSSNTMLRDSVTNIFPPFTLLGLFRLCAAGYLSSTGFAYTTRDNVWKESAARTADLYVRDVETDGNSGGETMKTTQIHRGEYAYSDIGGLHHLQHDSYDHITHGATVLINDRGRTMAGIARYHSTKYIPSVLFRCIYMLFMFLIWTISILRGTPIQSILAGDKTLWDRTFTNVISSGFYIFFMSCTCAFIGVYFWRGGTRSTIIPCVGKLWYKAYTVMVFAWMVTTFVVACCETSKLPCNAYTSLGEAYWPTKTACKRSEL